MDADQLILWKVLISYDSAKKNLVDLGHLQASEKEKLDSPMIRLNKVFAKQPSDNTIGITVEQPRQ
ncbi:hypothetical protein BGZ65_009886, partial [Modicella reniformis]